MIYIQNAYRALELGEDSEPRQKCMVSPNHCRFGRWYSEGDGVANFAHLPSYGGIDSPHRAVHHNVRRALELAQGDWKASDAVLDEILAAFRVTEDRSDELMGRLGGLAQEKHQIDIPGTAQTVGTEIS
jgi:hypothetical protein